MRRLLVLLFSGAPAGVPAAEPPGGELITGIMHPAGAAGSQTPPGADWTLRFTLEEWRRADGTIHTTPLSVTRTTTHNETQALMDRLNSRRVVSVRVRFTGENTAELLDVVDTRLAADDPLLLRAELLSTPVTHEDERFGTLVLDRSAGWWEGTAAWGADTIVVQMEAENEVELAASLRTARALWDDQAAWAERIRAFAVQSLLPRKNESWLDEGEAKMTPAGFRAGLRLESVTVDAEGGFTFWYDGGDLFWGHSIEITGTLRDGPTRADLPG
ncbi:MAG TPA: DUF2262 domain-containing protein [Longimicrobium sp.]